MGKDRRDYDIRRTGSKGHTDWVNGALLLPDTRRALSWSDDSTLRLWDLETGAAQTFKGHDSAVTGALLLPDAHRVLSWSGDNTLRLWDLTNEQELSRYVSDSYIATVLFSPDLQLLMVGDNRGRVVFFDLPD